jgi:isochorismate hydrolase
LRILNDAAVAVIIDIQEKLFPHIYANEQLAENCRKLISGLLVLEVPLLVTEQYTAGLGPTITPLQEILSESYVPVEKLAFSCCGAPDFMNKLKLSGKNSVILMGIETHVCVLQTALDLLENGFVPVIVEDCVSSRKTADKQIAIERMRSEGCVITSLESILLELCRAAGTDKFKAISRLIK